MISDGVVGGIIGAALTQSVTVVLALRKEWSAHGYLVAKISVQLESFASDCAAVVSDTGEEAPLTLHGETDWRPTVQLPTLSFDAQQVDWSVIDHDTLIDLLRLPIAITTAKQAIDGVADLDFTPPYSEVFYARQSLFATLGLDCCKLADELRDLHDRKWWRRMALFLHIASRRPASPIAAWLKDAQQELAEARTRRLNG